MDNLHAERLVRLTVQLMKKGYSPEAVEAAAIARADQVATTPLSVILEEFETERVNALYTAMQERKRAAAEERDRQNADAFR